MGFILKFKLKFLEYLSTLQKCSKWQYPSRNLSVGDVVVLMEDGIIPTNWPLARVIKAHPGKDGIFHVIDIKTPEGSYHLNQSKLAQGIHIGLRPARTSSLSHV